jgi:hypothetical protein
MGRPPCDDPEYQDLYQSLLQGCSAQALSADEGGRRLLGQLEELVRPWVSLTSLARTEPALLADLA